MRVLAVAATAWLAACFATPRQHLPDGFARVGSAVQTVEMAPFYFEGGAEGLDIYTDTDLFKRASEAFDGGGFREAFNLYRKIIDRFPGSDYRILAMYNGGLCLEKIGDFARALDYLRAADELTPDAAALSRDIAAHAGQALEQLGRHTEAAEAYRAVALREDVGLEERHQFESRSLVAYANGRASAGDIDRLTGFVERYRQFLEGRPDLDNQWLARARFALGEVHYRRFRAIELQLPQERLRGDLDRKAEELLRAQNQYMRTLQIRNVEWATAAVYRVGLLYEDFYHALNNAPAPSELSDEERTVYLEELRAATEPVRHKAIIAYDRIIDFANRLAVRTEWVEKARSRVIELRTLGRFSEPGNAALR